MKVKVFGNVPVKAGDELEVEIISKGSKGDGVAKHEGFIIFVPGTDVGDKVKVRITKVLASMSFAEVINNGGGEDG